MVTETHKPVSPDVVLEIQTQMRLLGHEEYGVTELRVFEPRPLVAYADDAAAVVSLCNEVDGRVPGVYVGVQPRPAHRFDQAPNHWVPAHGDPNGNCAKDADIEYIVALVWDIDVVSSERQLGHPANDEELERTLLAARLLSQQEGLALSSAITCTGNGHQLWAPIIPISVDGPLVALQLKHLCEQLATSVADKVNGVRFDPIFNLSRVARVSGPWNLKGQPSPNRPHRRARFVTEPPVGRSLTLHYMFRGTEVHQTAEDRGSVPKGLTCDLAKLEKCEFIQWCRRQAQEVSEPQWFALISNLVQLEGGTELIHAISALDGGRYDYGDTQRLVERTLREGYKPVSCAALVGPAMVRPGRGVFHCSRIGTCLARAPLYLATNRIVYTR